jgi:phage-related protein
MRQSNWLPVRFYQPIRRVIRSWPTEVKKELGALLTRLQKGEPIGMPDVRAIPSVGAGVSEIRIADRSGSYRSFHLMHSRHGTLIFHAFTKKISEHPHGTLKPGASAC